MAESKTCYRVSKTFLQALQLFYLHHLLIANILTVLLLLALITGCVSKKVGNRDFISTYQEALVEREIEEPGAAKDQEHGVTIPDLNRFPLDESKDSNGKKTIGLTLETAVAMALANSPEIRVVSFDPSISGEGIAVAISEFEVAAFGEVEYDEKNSLSNDIFQSDKTHSSLWKAGIRQKGVTGAEWSLAYSLTRSFDESIPKRFSTSYEPILIFELRQPLLSGAWPDINLAGLNISKLNYRITLATFRQKAEEVSTEVISLYWNLLRARRDVEIQQGLLDKTMETLRKVRGRKKIDATEGDVRQAETSVKSREAALLEDKKRLSDLQDRLALLLSDPRIGLTSEIEIIPETLPDTDGAELDQSRLLKLALENHPAILRSELEVEVAGINAKVAKRERMPRLDIVASAKLQGLSDSEGDAAEMISESEYASYSIGMTLEFPLDNQGKKAAYRQRKLKHSKARLNLLNVTAQVTALVRERVRAVETAYRAIQVHRDAVKAAQIFLQTLEDIETIRKKLTPEFLLAKIQAQGSLADAQKAEIKAVADYNIGLTKVAQAVGKVLDLRYVRTALPAITGP